MNFQNNRTGNRLLAIGGVLLLSGCAAPPTAADSAATVDSKLTQLQPDSQLTNLKPFEIKATDSARVDSLAARTDAVIAREVADAVRLNTEDLQRQISDTNAHSIDPAKK